ncbi:helix-turn-helix transcriptional regulator [Streptomyces sp. NPDC046985]|uniref:helix-turn-helix transcriptional regulator n=1 Tax=Streptomyces sp. NPDC046985 TaxID=3155377 RepID=UPI0034092CD2
MQRNLGERLTLDDLADAAMFSKYHFSRTFLRATGVPPGRFLSALRLEKAKELLLTTDWNVVDIGTAVGYNSVGTFSTRFSRSVGLSPTNYRRFRGFAPHLPDAEPWGYASRGLRIRGTVSLSPHEEPRGVFVGLFPGPIPEGSPLAGTLIPGPGPYELVTADAVSGHLAAFSLPAAEEKSHALADAGAWRVCGRQFTTHGPGTGEAVAHLTLAPRSRLDLPVLMAAPRCSMPFGAVSPAHRRCVPA